MKQPPVLSMTSAKPVCLAKPDGACTTSASTVLALYAALTVAVVAMVRVAWIADDSLITLRTALNWANGWGPFFNAAEAVQAYTHPAWFLLWTGLGLATGEWILTITAASIAFTAAAFLLATTRGRNVYQVLPIAAALLASNAFMEYSASGLENPLAYLVAGLLLALTASRSADSSDPHAIAVGVLVALLALTRLDLLLVAAPAGAVYTWQRRRAVRQLALAAFSAVVPLAAWFMWSYRTYATLLPNTFAAKRNIDIPFGEVLVQGIRYLRVSLTADPGTGLVAAVAVAVIAAWGSARQRAWAVGASLYVMYVVSIGGDFMAGRFVAVPLYVVVVAAAISWAERYSPAFERRPAETLAVATTVCLIVIMSVAGRVPVSISPWQGERWDFRTNGGVADERGIHVEGDKGVYRSVRAAPSVPAQFVFQPAAQVKLASSLTAVRAASLSWPRRTNIVGDEIDVGVRCGNLGIAGMVSGPTAHWIDPCGLTDRYLAQKVFSARNFAWRAGHYSRRLPDGYEEAVRHGDPSLLSDRNERLRLAELWAKIRRPVRDGSKGGGGGDDR